MKRLIVTLAGSLLAATLLLLASSTTSALSPNEDCSYTEAAVNNGWGWNPITETSCAPLEEPIVPDEDDCDYSQAGIHNGWGWNPVTETSCEPIDDEETTAPVVVTPPPTPTPTPTTQPTPTPVPTQPTNPTGNPAVVDAGITVKHRAGQTFLTWDESGDARYHVYRHDAPITNANIGSATLLTERWGPLDQDTSVNQYGGSNSPRNFVINDLDSPLRDNQGLFVHTVQPGQQGQAYYAVTTVRNGSENTNIVSGQNSSTRAVNETLATPRPVLTVSKNGGNGRIYTQYMDYSKWNPTFNGYAFEFAVALPAGYNAATSYPLRVELHAYGGTHKYVAEAEYDWPVIQLFPNDPGESVGATHTWWYGYAADHNYQTQGSTPNGGTVENFTQQRVVAAAKFLIDDGQFNVNEELVHAFGHSMGGSGALSFGIHYPSLFAGIYASEPMTNYGTNPMFQDNFLRLWGPKSANLPIVNDGPYSSAIQKYGVGGSRATRVWDWMNHPEQLRVRRADRFAYLMVDHGKSDTVIDWETQGKPMAQAFTDSRVGFSAAAVGGAGHSWLGFDSVVTSQFGFGYGDEAGWRQPRTLSFPGIHNASGSGSLQPANSGDDRHNTTIEWVTPINSFGKQAVDTSNTYEITIRSNSGVQTADITPRNTNAFKPSSGQQCSWTAYNNDSYANVGSGSATVDGSQLLTITGVQIGTGAGTRLAVTCP